MCVVSQSTWIQKCRHHIQTDAMQRRKTVERGVAHAISSCEMEYYSITIAICIETSSFYEMTGSSCQLFFFSLLFSLSLSGTKTGILTHTKKSRTLCVFVCVVWPSTYGCVCVCSSARVRVDVCVSAKNCTRVWRCLCHCGSSLREPPPYNINEYIM